MSVVLQQLVSQLPSFPADASPDEVAKAIQGVQGETPQSIADKIIYFLSPSGSLAWLASAESNLHSLFWEFDSEDKALHYLDNDSFVERLEEDFAIAVPAIIDISGPLLNWALPLLSALAGPLAPLVSFGAQVAIKILFAALSSWAKKKVQHT